MSNMEYAIYKDDEFICIGTLKEIASYLGVTYGTLRSYKSRKYYELKGYEVEEFE